MFNLIKSNRMENLMQALSEVLESPLDDPMAPEWIGVQSRGMKQWVSIHMAQIFGVCAHVNFISPRQIIQWGVGGSEGPDIGRDVLTWALVEALDLSWLPPGGDTGIFSGISHYLAGDNTGEKRVMLAQNLARVMDDYQIYRPRMLAAWEREELVTEDPVEIWQSSLWRQISKSLPAGRLYREMVAFDGNPKAPLPQRICLFGISALAPAFLEILSALSQHTEVYQFLLTPSDQFFSYIRSPQEMARMAKVAGEAQEGYESGNPLLASLGRSVREFQNSLEETPYQEPFGELFEDPLHAGHAHRLGAVQSDILNLVNRRAGGEVPLLEPDPDDASLTLHACHSPMREAQVLKDLLLDAFESIPDLAPHDVIVMMPDIEAYTPFIEAVFSSEFPLPFSISDRRKKLESQTLDAFVRILGLAGSRLELSPVLDLLLSPSVGVKFNISTQEVEDMEARARAAGILWGWDEDHRVHLTGKAYGENTWAFGLERLFTGLTIPEGEGELMGPVLPLDAFEGTDGDLLGRFAHFVHTLFGQLSGLERDRTPGEWSTYMVTLVRSLMGPEDTPESEMGFLLQTLASLGDEAALAGFDGKISFKAMEQVLGKKLDQRIAQGSFFSGGITFCNLMPMRSIPFRVVCLMGMDEASFPRRIPESGFDLVARHPQRGDKRAREEDRCLFLESLLSARERMVITYTGFNIRDNSEIPCSGVVSELVDVLSASHQGEETPWFFGHGLHPFHPQYFTPGSWVFSYSKRQFDLAGFRDKQDVESGSASLPVPETVAVSGEMETVSLEDFVRFFRAPGRSYMENVLGIRLSEIQAPELDREPFKLGGLGQYELGQAFLKDYLDSTGEARELADGELPRARAGGKLPFGEQGKLSWELLVRQALPIRDRVQEVLGEELTPVNQSIDLVLGNLRIMGQTRDLLRRASGDFVFCTPGFSRLGPGRLLGAWIRHLVVSRSLEGSLSTLVVGRDPDGKVPVKGVQFTPRDEGAAKSPDTKGLGPDALEALVELYQRGSHSFLPFFPNSCFALAKVLAPKDWARDEENLKKAMAAATKVWESSQYVLGEGEDRYLSLYLNTPQGPIRPFGDPKAFETLGIWDLTQTIYQPLFDNLEDL